MKIALIDSDVMYAATLATTLKNTIRNVTVEFYEDITEQGISLAGLVIADPAPGDTTNWLRSFRRCHPQTPLLILTDNWDLITGTAGDPCYAMSKPRTMRDFKETVDLVAFLSLGRPYIGGVQDMKRCN